MKKIKTVIPYIAAVLISLLVSFPAVSNSIVLDEAYTVRLVRGNIASIIQGAASDVHPPLYYLILKLFELCGGESLLKYRLVTAVGTYLNLLLLGATIIRKQWGCRVSILYILWFGLTYSTLEKTTFIRMYSWGAFFVTTAAILMFLYYQNSRKRDFILGIVMTIAAMYTHYYALITVFFIWLFLLLATFIKKRKKAGYIILGGAMVVIGYLPWLGRLLAQSKRVADNFWMKYFDWNEWKMVPAALMETSDGDFVGIGMVLYVFLMILLLLALIRKKWNALLCAAVFACTMITGAVLSVFITPIWATRYMYVGWGLIALFVAIVAGDITSVFPKITQGLLVAVLAVVGAVSVNTMLNDETMKNTADEWVDFLENNIEKEACIIVDDPAEHWIVYDIYLPEAKFICTEGMREQNVEERLSNFLEHSNGHQIWYIIDYRQQKIGVDKMKDYLEGLGYSLNSAGFYVIKQKDLEVFQIEEIQYDK